MRAFLAPLLAVAAALAFVAVACAQPDPASVANDTLNKGKSAVDGLLDGKGAGDGNLPAAAAPVDARGGSGSGLGRFFAVIADASVVAASVMGRTVSAAGTWMASGLAAGVAGGVVAATDGLAALGGALSAVLAAFGVATLAVGGWVGSLLAGVLGAYAGAVGALRPRGMDPGAFQAVAAAGAAGSSAVAGWGLWALVKRYAWVLSGAGGFSRIEDSELLDHPLRSQVFHVIKENPGIHASELARKVGAGWGTIVHHLDKLEKGRLVTTRRVNNQKCFFEDGGKVSRADMQIASAVRGDSASLITSYVQSHPMTSQKAMASELGISPALASFHVKKLAAVGVLDKVRRGKETLLTTTQAVRRVLTPSAPMQVPVAVQA